MNANVASKTYERISDESGVAGADPHKLISMLYQGALLAIAKAKNSMMRIAQAKSGRHGIKSADIAAKGAAISQAVAIIGEGLNASLDKKVGGELAQNLSSLYDYMAIRLTQANLHNDMAKLDEVVRLLNELKGAWDSIRPSGTPAAAPSKLTLAAAPKANVASSSTVTPPKAVNKVQMLYGRM